MVGNIIAPDYVYGGDTPSDEHIVITASSSTIGTQDINCRFKPQIIYAFNGATYCMFWSEQLLGNKMIRNGAQVSSSYNWESVSWPVSSGNMSISAMTNTGWTLYTGNYGSATTYTGGIADNSDVHYTTSANMMMKNNTSKFTTGFRPKLVVVFVVSRQTASITSSYLSKVLTYCENESTTQYGIFSNEVTGGTGKKMVNIGTASTSSSIYIKSIADDSFTLTNSGTSTLYVWAAAV